MKVSQNFTMIPNNVLRDNRLCTKEKAILFLLMSYSKDHYPSHAQIAELLDIDPKTVNTKLKELKTKNVIDWKPGFSFSTGNGQTNNYIFNDISVWKIDNHGNSARSTTGAIGCLIIPSNTNNNLSEQKSSVPDSPIEFSKKAFKELLEKEKYGASCSGSVVKGWVSNWIKDGSNLISFSELKYTWMPFLKKELDQNDTKVLFEKLLKFYESENEKRSGLNKSAI